MGREALISEVAKLQNLRNHRHIVAFVGVTKRPLALIVELCAGGCLVQRVRALTAKQRRSIATGVAAGVQHLHLENLVHRDLAARNVLLTAPPELAAKVADFGW